MSGRRTVGGFLKRLGAQLRRHNDGNGAAALAYFLMLSIFPMAIALLSLLPYLPIPNLHGEIMNLLHNAMPGPAAELFEGVVHEVVDKPHGRLLTFGAIVGLGSATKGMYAIMQQLNVTYDVRESRPFYRIAVVAVGLMLSFLLLVLGTATLIVMGDWLQAELVSLLGLARSLGALFATLRWAIAVVGLLLGFAITYRFGPDVRQDFRFVTPGSIFGALVLIIASYVFKIYVHHFDKYSRIYGSLGTVIILMLWLYLSGWALILGSEINALVEHFGPADKSKSGKRLPWRMQPSSSS